MDRFQDRRQAGRILAQKLLKYAPLNPVILALPRGGIPLGFEVSCELGAPLDLFPVRKIAAPGHEDWALGALAEGEKPFFNEALISRMRIDQEDLERNLRRKKLELEELISEFRQQIEALDVAYRTVILVDDGMATGDTMCAAALALRNRKAARLIAAFPVASEESVLRLTPFVDEIVCPLITSELRPVSSSYREFGPVATDEALKLLKQSRGQKKAHIERRQLWLHQPNAKLLADLSVPDRCRGLVMFAHGSGSSRQSPRNRFVAEAFHKAGFATCLFDLFTDEEQQTQGQAFDLPLLTLRLQRAANEVSALLPQLPMAFYGTSTGAAVILDASVQDQISLFALISRGGRPDLSQSDFSRIECPTLLLVGAEDKAVLPLNRLAQQQLPNAELHLISGATHLFEEPGALEKVVEHSIDWLTEHLPTQVKEERPSTHETLPTYQTPM